MSTTDETDVRGTGAELAVQDVDACPFRAMLTTVPVQPPARFGRPTTYTREMAAEVCRRVSQGETLHAIGQDPDMPAHSTVIAWQMRVPDFSQAIRRAQEHQGEAWGERAIVEAMAAHDKESSMVARVRAETLLKAAARRDPARWGERRDSGPSLTVNIATDITPRNEPINGEYSVTLEAEPENHMDINDLL